MTELKSPSRDNAMDIDTDCISPIRQHIKFGDRYKTLLQESPPPRVLTDTIQKSPLSKFSPKSTELARKERSPITIKNEDRGQWREEDAAMDMQEKKVQELKQPEKDEVEKEKSPTATTTITNKSRPSKIPSPTASKGKLIPHYMMATTSFKSKYEAKKKKGEDESLGVRTVGKISKRSTPSKIPRYKKAEDNNNNNDLNRLSFKGSNYIPMASRVKSFEKGLRQFKSDKAEKSNSSINSSNNSKASDKRTSTPSRPSSRLDNSSLKIKPFKFATDERAKRHQQQK